MSSITEIRNQLTQIIELASQDDILTNFSIANINSLRLTLQSNRDVSTLSIIPIQRPIQLQLEQFQIRDGVHPHSDNTDKIRIQHLLRGFDQKSSPAWQEITTLYGPDVKHTTLCLLAKILSSQIGVSLDRDSKRRKSVLVKWYHDNWALIQPLIRNYQIEGDSIFKNGKIQTI